MATLLNDSERLFYANHSQEYVQFPLFLDFPKGSLINGSRLRRNTKRATK
jgi:hypothetical protein